MHWNAFKCWWDCKKRCILVKQMQCCIIRKNNWLKAAMVTILYEAAPYEVSLNAGLHGQLVQYLVYYELGWHAARNMARPATKYSALRCESVIPGTDCGSNMLLMDFWGFRCRNRYAQCVLRFWESYLPCRDSKKELAMTKACCEAQQHPQYNAGQCIANVCRSLEGHTARICSWQNMQSLAVHLVSPLGKQSTCTTHCKLRFDVYVPAVRLRT